MLGEPGLRLRVGLSLPSLSSMIGRRRLLRHGAALNMCWVPEALSEQDTAALAAMFSSSVSNRKICIPPHAPFTIEDLFTIFSCSREGAIVDLSAKALMASALADAALNSSAAGRRFDFVLLPLGLEAVDLGRMSRSADSVNEQNLMLQIWSATQVLIKVLRD